jgi:acetyltransferase-like isoleucine patch superfamily enzyme
LFWFAKKERLLVRKIRGFAVSRGRNVTIGRGCFISNVVFSDGVTIEDYVRIIGNPSIYLGKDVYINCFSMISGEIRIEDNVLISQYVNIWGSAHRFIEKNKLVWDQYGKHGVTDQGYDIAPVVIKRGSWIGPQVVIFRGVTIGEGAIIGANSTVTKDIPDFAVAYGSPAHVVKYRR